MIANVLLAAVLIAAPIPNSGKMPDPIATFHYAPAEVLEKDFFHLISTMPSPDSAESVKKMKDHLKSVLGEKGWDGLDVKKPGTGYVIFDEKTPEKSYGFLVLPAKDEKSFLDFLGRFGKAMDEKNQLVPVEGIPGLHQLKGKNNDVPKHVRVHNGYAYIGFNAPLESYSADRLIPAEKTLNPKETAKIAVTVRASKLPKEWINQGLKELDRFADDTKRKWGDGAPVALKTATDKGATLIHQYANMIMDDGDTFGLRMHYENEIVYELFLKGKADTKLATEIAARPASTNRFAEMINDQTSVAGFLLKMPFYNEEIRTLASTTVTEVYKELCVKDPPPAAEKPFWDKFVPRLASTIKSGQFDVAGAIQGPSAKGTYSLAMAIAFDDAVGMSEEFKSYMSNLLVGMIEWDTDEVEGLKAHKLNVLHFLPADMRKKLFGEKPNFHFTLTKTGLLIAVGQNSLDDLKKMMAYKTSPAPLFGVKVNASKLVKCVGEVEPRSADQVESYLGKDDKMVTRMSADITGGDELRLRFNPGSILYTEWFGLRMIGGVDGVRKIAPVPPPAKPVQAVPPQR